MFSRCAPRLRFSGLLPPFPSAFLYHVRHDANDGGGVAPPQTQQPLLRAASAPRRRAVGRIWTTVQADARIAAEADREFRYETWVLRTVLWVYSVSLQKVDSAQVAEP